MATLAPPPKSQFFDSNGDPLANGKLYTYESGTTTPLATYTDSTAATENTNPIILNSRGEASVWLGAGPYKFVLKDSSDVTIYTVDGVAPTTDSTSATTYSNKTFDNTNTVTLKDANFTLQDDSDTTKQARFQLSGISASTTRTYTLPDATGTIFLNSMATSRLLGRTSASTGAIEEISVTSPVTLSSGALSVAAGSESASGILELATSAEVATGTDTARVPSVASLRANALVLGTAQSATGTEIDFTGIPSWVKHIALMFDSVSLSGSDQILVQIGDVGGVETTGYTSGTSTIINPEASFTSTSGFIVIANGASNPVDGVLHLYKLNGNIWLMSGVTGVSSNGVVSNGRKELSTTLDRVRVTRDGLNNFDAGTINIIYE